MTIKAARVNAKLTQRQVCDVLGVAVSTLIHWEQDETFPTAVQLKKLCEMYGCKMDDIFIPERLTVK
jgi:transcriptional regulator with XRE-family HTH domain